MNDRGHTADDVRRASALIRSFDIELGLQMMTGLYGSSAEDEIYTAREFIKLKPSTVRIYPTIVMKNTRLGELYGSGLYRPQTVDEAVDLCGRLIPMFENEGIKVIRVGLHDSETLKRDMLSGPYHPAFRELCESREMLSRARLLLLDHPQGTYTLTVNPKFRSKMTGNKRSNLIALRDLGYEVIIKEDDALIGKEIALS